MTHVERLTSIVTLNKTTMFKRSLCYDSDATC